MNKIIWTPEIEKIIKDNHNIKTLPQIKDMLGINNITYSGFRSKCQRMGLFRDRGKIHIPTKSYNSHNTEYWKEPNLINCYLAGLIAADGCLGRISKNGSMIFSYGCARKDECILDLLMKELNFNGKKTFASKKSPRSDTICHSGMIQIACFDKNAEYLKQYFNIAPNKTFRLGPINLTDKKLTLAFLVGYIDGDGCIQSGRNLSITFTTASLDFITWVKEKLDEYFVWSYKGYSTVIKPKNQNYYRLCIDGTRAAIIFDQLNKINVPKLERKWNKPEVLAYVESQKLKFPHLFPDSISQNSAESVISVE